jgi:hypothetical protein
VSNSQDGLPLLDGCHAGRAHLLLKPCLQKSGRLGVVFEVLEDSGVYKDFVKRRGEKLKSPG